MTTAAMRPRAAVAPPLQRKTSWDATARATVLGSPFSPPSSSPAELLAFLAQVERIHVRTVRGSRHRAGDALFCLDVYLTDAGGDLADAPSYQLRRALPDFTTLAEEAADWTQHASYTAAPCCALCARVQTRDALRLVHLLSPRVHSGKMLEAPLQSLVNDMLEMARSPLDDDTPTPHERPCAAMGRLAALVARFLVVPDRCCCTDE